MYLVGSEGSRGPDDFLLRFFGFSPGVRRSIGNEAEVRRCAEVFFITVWKEGGVVIVDSLLG